MRVLKNERLEKEVLLTISKNDVLRDVQSELLSLSHQVKKHGFRSGKIPTKILFQERGDQALNAVAHKHVLQAFSDIVGDQKLAAPLSYAIETDLSDISIDHLPDLDIRVTAVFIPEIQEISWKGISLDHYVVQPTEEEVNADLANAAQRLMTSAPLAEKRPAALGDTLVYTMTYTHQDGTVKEVEGSFQLGSNALPKEFEETLEGVSEGHVMSESLRVPKDFPDKSLAGKKVKFTIAFHEIRQTVPHEVNEAFAKAKGFQSLDDLREDAKKSLVQSAQIMSEILVRNHLRKKLGELQDFDVPESWVKKAFDTLKNNRASLVKKQNQIGGSDVGSEDVAAVDESVPESETASVHGDTEENLQAKALAMVRGDFIVRKVISENHFSVKDSEIFAYAQAMARTEGRPLDDVIGFLRRNKSVVDSISNDIQERKALDWISSQCAKQDKEVSLTELRNTFAETSV